MKYENQRIVEGAAQAVDLARMLHADYAGERAPLRTDQMAELMRRAGCHVEVFPFRSTVRAMALPRINGVYPVFLDRGTAKIEKSFVLRHELAHVLSGDLDQATYLMQSGCMAEVERIADTFALADLVPAWWIRQVRREVKSARHVRREITAAIRLHAEEWTNERAQDRARLRWQLYYKASV